MVTKGIITSIDFNGNTCQVRIPLFETAGNDPITGTAIVSNTPGSYNGYKVGDVVLVAFEDGKMQNPVIVGKLYLGAAKEKQDPRGTINVETTTASKSASLPADAVLTANVDSNVPNTNTPFGSLASIANNLNSLNTDVNQLDRFTRNQFNSVITDVNDQGEQLRSEIKQTAGNIEANVVHKHQNGSQNALGWDLDEKEWKINAQDTVNGVVKDINIVTIDRNGMSIAGDLKLSGYPRNITVLYAQNGSDKTYPTPLYNFTKAEFPVPFPSGDEDKDKTWYYGKYIKIEEKYVLIFKENFEQYDINIGTTIAYNRNINSETWSIKMPERADGQYIWQWTHTETYSFDGDKWDEQDDDKITCITGATGSTGEPATTYWAKLSTAVHTGKNQKSDIEIIPYAKTGNSQEVVDTTAYFNYSLDNGANWKNDDWTSIASLQDNKIIISANDIRADNIIVKLAHAYTDPGNTSNIIYGEYEAETITYSPLNTPIIDLTNDTDVIKYKPDGNKITADVSSTAQVYLGGSPEEASYNWTVTSGTATISKSNSNQTVTITSITSDKAIITCTATTTNFKDENGKAVQISKDFVVSREVVVASYWLSFSPIHTGNLQQTDVEVKALAKIGNDGEGPDENAYLRYKWDNESNWSDWNKNATLIIPKADIQNNNLRIQATHDSEGDNRQVYEDETITYSPLNTPVLDLTNDNDAIAYDGNTILGNSVSSTAVVYLNGSVISGCTFAWTATNCTISGATDSNTVTVSAIDDNKSEGTATCKVTLIPNYPNTELVKVFTVAKQYKGNHGADGPTPTSSTTYYIYSADMPDINDAKWETDPANLEKPSGGYFCWTKTVTKYSDSKTITDGPNKDAAFALAQGKSTNYYSPTAPSVNIQEGDCWFKTISSTDDEYNNEMSDQDQGKLYQCSGFDANGKAIWKDVGGELVANKLTANYINALDITAKKITVLNNNNAVQSDSNPILFEADGLSGTGSVKIANFTVKNDKLYSGEHDEIGSTKAGIYLGSKGLSIGSSFKITTGVDGTDPKIAIVGYTKSVEKKYCIVSFAVVTTTTNKPVWWDDWNDAHWSDTPPNREDGSYIWEWTKTTSTTDTDTDNTKDTKVCITGAKGDPGNPGVNPYVGSNGNWWIGNDDTGVKAKGTDGHTPEVTIGENGNWYIDGKDTGVLAKGTPGEPGKTGRSVSSVTKFYKRATSKPDKPSNKEPTDWSTSPPSFVKGNNYYESDRTIYDSVDGAGNDYSWSDVIENSMLTVDFINSLGITAQGLKVVDEHKNLILSANIADDHTEHQVQIGGFTVDSNRLYAGTPGTDYSIELASFHNLIAYKSNNQGVASSYAVSKITVNKDITNLTVYIRSDAESNFDYTIISNPISNPDVSYPTSYSSSDVKAHTRSNQNNSSALTDYTKVEYDDLKQNDFIYVVYRKDTTTNSGTDTGYLLIPETTDISITAVGDTYYFERDTSLDTKEAGASLKVGSNFSVDRTGAIKSTSGTIGGFEVTSDYLHTAGTTIGNTNSLFLSSNGVADSSGIGGSSGEQTWSITAGGNFGVTKDGTVYANDMVMTDKYGDRVRIGTEWSGMYFQNIYNGTVKNDCYVRANEIKDTGRGGYNIVFADSQDKNYSASISIQADKPVAGVLDKKPHYAWEQGIELQTCNPADNASGALANNAALRIGYYKGDSVPTENKKGARGFLGDVWCPTGIFRCKNGNIVPYIYGFKSGLYNTYSDKYEYGFYFDSKRLDSDSWASWYYGDTFTGIDCVIVSMGHGTAYEDTIPDIRPGHLPGSQATENSFYFDDHINKYVYWCNDTSYPWTVDVFIVGYKQRAAGTFIGDQEIK